MHSHTDSLSYASLTAMAWPFILANASVPLLGIVDTAVIGNTGSVVELGAIALGSLIFSFVYWSFGFLRMGTTGFIAQADGSSDPTEVRAILGRSCIIALFIGALLLVIQWPIGALSFSLLSGDAAVESVAKTYFYTRIWGAPATLLVFVIMGVWIGLGEAKELLKLQLFLNGLEYGAGYSCRWGFGAWCLWHCSWHRFFRDHHLPGRVLPIATMSRRETRGWCRLARVLANGACA